MSYSSKFLWSRVIIIFIIYVIFDHGDIFIAALSTELYISNSQLQITEISEICETSLLEMCCI